MNEGYLVYLNKEVTTENNNKYIIVKYISEGGNGFVLNVLMKKEKIMF